MKDTELIRAKSFGITAVAYFFNNLVRFIFLAGSHRKRCVCQALIW